MPLLVAASFVGVHAGPASAQTAYWPWGCDRVSASQCYSGYYWHWMRVHADMVATSSSICAKSITSAGNIKNGSGCAPNTNVVNVCITNYDPVGNGYVYWAGSGTTRHINGWEDTTACD